MEVTTETLIEQAKAVRKHAYIPYSKFAVGAAVLTSTGNVFVGCNIENAAYPVTCCAERVALFSAIAAGEMSFKKIVVVADTDRPVPPCGTCRQAMSEFFLPETEICLSNLQNNIETWTMASLLPSSFNSKDLKR